MEAARRFIGFVLNHCVDEIIFFRLGEVRHVFSCSEFCPWWKAYFIDISTLSTLRGYEVIKLTTSRSLITIALFGSSARTASYSGHPVSAHSHSSLNSAPARCFARGPERPILPISCEKWGFVVGRLCYTAWRGFRTLFFCVVYQFTFWCCRWTADPCQGYVSGVVFVKVVVFRSLLRVNAWISKAEMG